MRALPLARRPGVRCSAAVCSALLMLIAAQAPAQSQQPPASPPPKQDQPPAVVPVPQPGPPTKPDLKPEPKPGTPAEPDDQPEVVVYLKDGRQLKGLLVPSKPDEMVLSIAGIETRLKTTDIERYQVLPPLFERYTQLRAAAGDDPEQILRLAEWLQSRERYELALSEVQRLLRLDENHAEAKRLQLLLAERIRLKMATPKREPEPPKPTPDAGPAAQSPKDFPVLTPAQINLIKVFELELADNPRVTLPRATVLRMFDAFAGHPSVPATQEGRDAMLRRDLTEILALMFELRARDFYAEVQVLDTPKPIAVFRDSIARTWLNNSCATTQCHGGTDAGRLVLINRRAASDAALYTNLLILSRFQTAKGQDLINWDVPERSPLLQMGLPREQAVIQHPEVLRGVADHDAWRPTFRGKSDPRFKKAVDWIKSMRRPRPDYPIEYTPLRPLRPETVPAKSPASAAPPKAPAGAKPPASTQPPPAEEPKPR